MQKIQGKAIVPGQARAPALVTEQPINFTASMCKVPNMLPSKRAEVRDAHHELFKQNIAGKVLVFPSCIGSTHTGLVLLDLVSFDRAPAAIIVQHADSLLVSGVVLADVWYHKSIAIIEVDDDKLFDKIHNQQMVTVKSCGTILIDD
ncbi:DUF126 domain-containing protein [Thalassotalea sp. HSM 43]|uniref:aconitase X swivel domain-containing protein n=1 Tax=Thalassotalea sp. HSM 43 TaxID=2552945 RepID=UPI0010820BDF|nr:DUF126 domain-containing protein [Thalassotalea sp. HSM 43]QBY04047.1 DUF126 domain-containing protein [Thalassotalea sp. HSM 43]